MAAAAVEESLCTTPQSVSKQGVECQQGAGVITHSLTWGVKLSTAAAPHLSRRRLGATETQTSVSSSSPHLIFLHPRNLPKAPLQHWSQYFVTESLRLLGTQRHLWESSLSLSLSLNIILKLLRQKI